MDARKIPNMSLPEFLSNSMDTGYASLASLLLERHGCDAVSGHLKSLIDEGLIRLTAPHAKYRVVISSAELRFRRITSVPADRQSSFLYPRKSVKITDFYRQRHGITLQYPSLPCVEAIGGPVQVIHERNQSFFPLELLEVNFENKYRIAKNTFMLHAHRWGPRFNLNLPGVVKPYQPRPWTRPENRPQRLSFNSKPEERMPRSYGPILSRQKSLLSRNTKDFYSQQKNVRTRKPVVSFNKLSGFRNTTPVKTDGQRKSFRPQNPAPSSSGLGRKRDLFVKRDRDGKSFVVNIPPVPTGAEGYKLWLTAESSEEPAKEERNSDPDEW